MSRPADQFELPDWLQPQLQWITLPSWLLSVFLHALVGATLLMVSRLPGCQPDIVGDAGESFHEIGLYVRPEAVADSVAAAEPSDQPPSEAPTPVAAPTVVTAPAPQPVPEQPPVPLLLPAVTAPPVIGAGGPPRSAAFPNQLLQSTPGGGSSGAAASGQRDGSTTFMGIRDAGKRFVYAIDSSSSMADYGAFRVAKTELLASLERLTETQQFQVLFCNSAAICKLNAKRFDMFFGTDAQRLEVRLQIAGIGTDAGTDHQLALFAALDLKPDVIFYLSDGGEPYLTAKQLDEIHRRNRGSRIHCIEFGRGAAPLVNGEPAPNFLTKLAAQNNGRYLYRDVSQFSGR